MRHEQVTCIRCGWVHFAAGRAEILSWGADGGLERFAICDRCGGSHKNVRPSLEADAPPGCTIGPILDPNENI